jgi:hypothetical protein
LIDAVIRVVIREVIRVVIHVARPLAHGGFRRCPLAA